MEVLRVSTINEQGKVTVPKKIRDLAGVEGEKGRMVWYRDGDSFVVEIRPEEVEGE